MNYSIEKQVYMKKLIGMLFLTLTVLTGCRSPKDVSYFQDANENTQMQIAMMSDLRIQPQDKLTIVVNSRDPQLAALFNLPIYSRRVGSTQSVESATGQQSISTYTVDMEGNIDFPVLGSVKISGMNRQEIAAYLKNRLVSENLCNDAVVTVEFSNMYINVLGEVKNPGRFQLTQDKVTVLDAIGMAGDLNIQGRRYNVKVIRNEGSVAHTYVMDMTSLANLANSPAYYLRQGDVVYVDPNNYRQRQTTVNGNNVLSTAFWISLASLLASVINIIL